MTAHAVHIQHNTHRCQAQPLPADGIANSGNEVARDVSIPIFKIVFQHNVHKNYEVGP